MGLTGRLVNRKIVTSWARYDDLDQPAPKNVSRSCPIIKFGYFFVVGKVPFLNDRLPLQAIGLMFLR